MRFARLLGHGLLWVGFLAGAFLATCRTENAADPWATICWPAYAAALGIAIAGVVILRASKRIVGGGTERHAGAVDRMAVLLGQLLANVEDLLRRKTHIPVHDFHLLIEEHMSDDLAEFADLRESLISAFGLETYAAIMTEFALSERTINRIWSASADGYVDEVHTCLERALGHLQAAIERLAHARQAAIERLAHARQEGRSRIPPPS